MNTRLLEGVKVIELATFVAAPSCGRLLADFGADVIKVESPSGDDFRQYGVTCNVTHTEDENPLWDIINGEKKCITVNLKTPEGMSVFKKLLKTADVFLTNTRFLALKRLGIDYESIKEEYPSLVYAYVSGYGTKGRDSDKPGFDSTAYWARGGLLMDMPVADDWKYPAASPNAYGDMITGMSMLAGINAALFSREKTGKGDFVDVSLLGCSLWMNALTLVSSQTRYGNKFPRRREEISPAAFETKDGRWILPVIAVNFEKFFPLLCSAIGRNDLLEDERFKTRDAYFRHKKDYIEIMNKAFKEKTSGEWSLILKSIGCTFDLVSKMSDAIYDEQAMECSYIRFHDMPCGEKCRIVTSPIHSANNGQRQWPLGSLFSADTRAVLLENGYSEEEINCLSKKGAVKLRQNNEKR